MCRWWKGSVSTPVPSGPGVVASLSTEGPMVVEQGWRRMRGHGCGLSSRTGLIARGVQAGLPGHSIVGSVPSLVSQLGELGMLCPSPGWPGKCSVPHLGDLGSALSLTWESWEVLWASPGWPGKCSESLTWVTWEVLCASPGRAGKLSVPHLGELGSAVCLTWVSWEALCPSPGWAGKCSVPSRGRAGKCSEPHLGELGSALSLTWESWEVLCASPGWVGKCSVPHLDDLGSALCLTWESWEALCAHLSHQIENIMGAGFC